MHRLGGGMTGNADWMNPYAPTREGRPVLLVDRNYSRCGACGKDALPTQERHDDVIGYRPGPGCGVRWTHIKASCVGPGIDARLREMRPDLTLIPSEVRHER